MLTPRENLLKALRHEMPEWIPICGHCDPYNQPSREGMDPALAAKLGPVNWGDGACITFSRWLGIDIMDWFGGVTCTRQSTVESDKWQEGADTVTVIHTPKGDLREVVRQCREDGTSYRIEHLLKSPKDLPAFAALFEDQEVDLNPDRLESLRQHRESIGDDGVVGVTLPGTPLGMLIRVYAGVETTAFLSADAPGAMADLFDVMAQRYGEMFRLASGTEGDVLITVDDTSTTTISPAMFERYCVDYTNRMADIAHAGGKLYFHHSCGLIRDLLPLYRETRIDAVHAFTIPPIGDVTVNEGKAALGPGIAIFAGLFQLLGQSDDPGRMESIVREMFEGAAPGDNFVLGLAADPNITMADTQKLVDICRKYQTID